MTLKWIATRTQDDGAFNLAGLGHPVSRVPSVQSEILPRGSLLIEAHLRPHSKPVTLLRFAALDPWPTGLTVCLEADGTLRLTLRQGKRHLETALKTGLGRTVQTAHITYVWDAPARRGQLGVHSPDHGFLWQTDVLSPFPLSTRDARRIVSDTGTSRLDESVTFAAIADAPCPLGPVPGLAGTAAIELVDGPKALRHVVAGDMAVVQGGDPAPVLWVGSATVPALGRFAPMTLRRPYMRLWDDLVAARDQRVCLAGSEVEYLFGEERVSTAVRHLEIRNCATPTRNAPAVMTYYQVLLETHEIITVNGAAVESFDGSAVLNVAGLVRTSVLADMPDALRPRNVGLAAPVLQGYEALTLTGMSVG